MISKRLGKKMMGFGQEVVDDVERRRNLLEHVTVEDVIEYGMIPELVGRLPFLSSLNKLNETDLVRVLTEPRNALVKQYQKLFEMEHAELEFTDSALREIARIARIKDTGARGLRSVIEEVMFDLMFELPDQEPGQRYIVTPEIVRKEKVLFVKDAAAA
jgi:ATP-dependent Clp protease ATP-binding subunit ClpX